MFKVAKLMDCSANDVLDLSANMTSPSARHRRHKRRLSYRLLKHMKISVAGPPESPSNVANSSLLVTFDEPKHNVAVVPEYRGWREVERTLPRAEGKRDILDSLFTNIRNARPAEASEIKEWIQNQESTFHGRKNMKKRIKNFFTTPKFVRSLKIGVYMACLLYNDDRVLVTEDSIIPIVEVDENFNGSLNTDFHWMMKVACTWEDVKSLRQEMERNSCSSTVRFRCKLLLAAAQLQNGLGIQDLGQFYHKPISDANGTVILALIQQVKETKYVNANTTKWTQIPKLQRRVSSDTTNEIQCSAADYIASNVQDLIYYHQSSQATMDQGLYLGYLKLCSSDNVIQLLVPHNMPNILPHVKIRECSHVSRDEWQWLKTLRMNDFKSAPTANQRNFQRLLVNKCNELLTKLNFSEKDSVSHRIYDMEVIELSPTVSFILLLPPVEAVCSVPGQNNQLLTNFAAHFPLSLQVFEMIHMSTYQKEFISLYSRLSSILEVDRQLAQQAQREAFSSEEVAVSRDRIVQVAGFKQTLDDAWRSVRWTMDVIKYSRNKASRGGLPLSILYAPVFGWNNLF